MAALGSCATAQDFPQSELFPAKANIVQHAACDTPRKKFPNVMGMASVGITSRPQAQGNSLLEGDGWAQTSHVQPSWSQNALQKLGVWSKHKMPQGGGFSVSPTSPTSPTWHSRARASPSVRFQMGSSWQRSICTYTSEPDPKGM